jgi:hypothetical protein
MVYFNPSETGNLAMTGVVFADLSTPLRVKQSSVPLHDSLFIHTGRPTGAGRIRPDGRPQPVLNSQ